MPKDQADINSARFHHPALTGTPPNVEIPMFPPYVGNIGMATYLVGVMAAAQNRKLMHVWDAAATSCPMNRHHSDEAQRSRNLFTRLKGIIPKKLCFFSWN
ncbi:MAG: hypothetical protein MJZ52_04815 [Bacteroidales bacterium]|nr:hypothetical protein [Bacteroidales bacterium]